MTASIRSWNSPSLSGLAEMFGANRAKARIAVLDDELQIARQRLKAQGHELDRAITDKSIQDMMRRALARVEKANRHAPPSE